MRDERTLPFRPLRDLAAEARLAVERSRTRRVEAIDKTLYVRSDRPKTGPVPMAAESSSASLLWAGVIAALLTWIAALALCLLA